MRGYDNIGLALIIVFAVNQSGWAMIFFGGYLAAWFVAASPETSLLTFLGRYEFAAFFLGSVALATIMTTFVGVVAWVSNSKSAKERGRVERLIDAWVVNLDRSGR
jgi:hypothetical protein